MRKFFLVIIYLILFLYPKNVFSIENKILLKIDKEIITTVDINNERNILAALNPKILKLDDQKIFEISKRSLVREKIKEIEIKKKIKDNKNINEENFENIIKNTYSKLDLASKEEFKNYLNSFGIKYESYLKKINIEVLWNELIFFKFSSKVKINKNELRDQILKKKEKSKSYFLHEIVYETKKTENNEKKYKEIIKSIEKNGFNNTALIYSIADSSKFGGKIGWVNQNFLNSKILKNISKIKIGEITKPIQIPGGFLLLKLENIKEEEIKINIEQELKKLIALKTNDQLNQLSNIYFNKIRKDTKIDEL